MSDFSICMAHGAGVGHKSTFLEQLAATICRSQTHTYLPIRFDYMKSIEVTGKRRPPPKFDSLIAEFSQAIPKDSPVIACGKSMGGRVATQLTHLDQVKGVVCLGFPFYPPGKKEKHRLAFLQNLQVPCLIIQGTRDAMGNKAWVDEQNLSPLVHVHWIEGADHDFNLLKNTGRSQQDVLEEIVNVMAWWIKSI